MGWESGSQFWLCATPNFKRGGESCEEKKLRKWQWSGGGENEETKVFIFTRFFLIHFVCTFYIYILNNKIDLELSGWLAWLYCITKHLCQLIIWSIFKVFHNYIRFNIQLEAKDKELPSKFMYLGGNDREKARTDFLCQEQWSCVGKIFFFLLCFKKLFLGLL